MFTATVMVHGDEATATFFLRPAKGGTIHVKIQYADKRAELVGPWGQAGLRTDEVLAKCFTLVQPGMKRRLGTAVCLLFSRERGPL